MEPPPPPPRPQDSLSSLYSDLVWLDRTDDAVLAAAVAFGRHTLPVSVPANRFEASAPGDETVCILDSVGIINDDEHRALSTDLEAHVRRLQPASPPSIAPPPASSLAATNLPGPPPLTSLPPLPSSSSLPYSSSLSSASSVATPGSEPAVFIARPSTEVIRNFGDQLTMAYPALYPYGRGSYDEDRLVSISLDAYVNHVLSLSSRAFAEHKLFMSSTCLA